MAKIQIAVLKSRVPYLGHGMPNKDFGGQYR